MKVGNWKDGFEAIGLIAIVASLVFVGFQLRQDQLIARSELTSDSFHLMIAMNQSLIGPEFASTYAKMLDRPEDLSLDEMVQIDNLLTAVKTMYLRECYLKAREIFVECDAIVRNSARLFFGNRYGQSWWRLNKPPRNSNLVEFPDWVDVEIENLDPNTYRQMLEETKARI